MRSSVRIANDAKFAAVDAARKSVSVAYGNDATSQLRYGNFDMALSGSGRTSPNAMACHNDLRGQRERFQAQFELSLRGNENPTFWGTATTNGSGGILPISELGVSGRETLEVLRHTEYTV